MLFFNHSSAESVRWVHLFFYNKESKVSQPQSGLFLLFSPHDLKDQFAPKILIQSLSSQPCDGGETRDVSSSTKQKSIFAETTVVAGDLFQNVKTTTTTRTNALNISLQSGAIQDPKCTLLTYCWCSGVKEKMEIQSLSPHPHSPFHSVHNISGASRQNSVLLNRWSSWGPKNSLCGLNQVSGSPAIPNWFEMTLFTPSAFIHQLYVR